MRTLHLRLERHQENALRVAEWFKAQDCVAGVLHPSLPEHPGQAIWARDADGTNGLLSVIFRDGFDLKGFLDALQLFVVGSSWGGFESLFKTFSLPDEVLDRFGKSESAAVRFHIGLEHIDDIVVDLSQAMTKGG
jgi:cystathionine beta-lyase